MSLLQHNCQYVNKNPIIYSFFFRLFGFPEYYTEANLTPNQRLALLGKSWSLQVIKSILCPLKNFFECN